MTGIPGVDFSPPAVREALYRSTQERWRPEDVAWLVLKLLPLSQEEVKLIAPAARQSCYVLSLKTNSLVTSMSDDFQRPVPPAKKAQNAAALFAAAPIAGADLAEPERILAYVTELGGFIRRHLGDNFKVNRLNRQQRQEAGLGELPKRRYNRLFRALVDLERKVEVYRREIAKYQLGRIAKSGLTAALDREVLFADDNALAFIAYIVANRNRRSVFTVGSQAAAFDKIAEMLLQRCKAGPTTHWEQIAWVYPQPAILACLNPEQRGRLLGRWYEVLVTCSNFLEQLWWKNEIRADTMIVKRGNDSSTWNAAAGAWNQARRAWLNLVTTMGMESLFEDFMPGKAMRLIAGDVAAWHFRAGDDWVDPEVKVWRALPFPWDVMHGRARCTRRMIAGVCREIGVDPVKTGWTAPKPEGEAVPYQETPELVHGVAVSSPELAARLRALKFFSGKAGAGEVLPGDRAAALDELLSHRQSEETKRGVLDSESE